MEAARGAAAGEDSHGAVRADAELRTQHTPGSVSRRSDVPGAVPGVPVTASKKLKWQPSVRKFVRDS